MNLERSATNSLPRHGKVHDGLGGTRHPGRDGAEAGGEGGFLSVLSALEPSAPAAPLDIGSASPALPGGADNNLVLPAVEPELPDASQLLPDAGWQLDTAALLAHLTRSSQCLSSGAGSTCAVSAAGLSGQAGLPGQAVALTMPGNASPSVAAAPADGVGPGVSAANRRAGSPSRIEPALPTPLVASLPAVGPDGPAAAAQVPAAPAQPARLQAAPPAAIEPDTTNSRAMLARPAPTERPIDAVPGLPVDLAKPGTGRLPPSAQDLAQPALPIGLRQPESVGSPIELPQTRAVGTVAPSPLAVTRGPTQAPQAEATRVADETSATASPVSPLPALGATGATPPQPMEPVKPMLPPAVPAHAAHETKALQNAVERDLAVPLTVGLNRAVPAGVPEGVSRSADRAAAKPVEALRGASGEGLWNPAALVSGRPVEAASATPSAALPTPEMMVAEQVSYWIAGKVQNAELRLDVFGRQPVDVSISMNGSEAQVEFRTDQAEVRQVLEGAVAHLKDLLKDEGLSLAGVFVGSSGQQRQGGQASPGPDSGAGLRQARVEVAQTPVPPKSASGHPTAGRSVDLFV